MRFLPSSQNQSRNDLDLDKFTKGDQELTIQLIEIFLKQVPEAIEN